MDKKFWNGLMLGSVVTMLLTLGVVTVIQNAGVVNLKAWNKLNRVTTLIENKYYGEWSEEEIIKGILQGSCFNLDSYSAYLTMEDYEDAVDADQEFGGIGVQTTFDKYTKVYKVGYCYDGAPAQRAGLQRNDIIEAVDGIDVYDMELDQMSHLIRGEPGTTVTLKVNRDGELLDIDVVREEVKLPYAYAYRLSDDIGFIKITSFTGDVVEDFEHALVQCDGCRGLVIDLRNNSGGTVESLKEIMELMMPSCIIQTTVYKDGTREPLFCESTYTEPKFKFAVLAGGGTASCAEAMTQALADVAGATIIGEETYGKGVVQEYFQVDKTSVVRLTVGYIESPAGVVWNEVGIKPDIEVEYEYLGDDYEESVLLNDNQILTAVEVLEAELKNVA